MSGALRAIDYLGHIAGAIERIERYTAGMSEEAFLENGLVRGAVVRNIEIIGEAANNRPLRRSSAGRSWRERK